MRDRYVIVHKFKGQLGQVTIFDDQGYELVGLEFKQTGVEIRTVARNNIEVDLPALKKAAEWLTIWIRRQELLKNMRETP